MPASTPTEDEVGGVYDGFDYAIAAVFASLVFDVSSEFGKNQVKLQNSAVWGLTEDKLAEGIKGVRHASLQAIGCSLLVIVIAAIGLSIPARELDERMILIMDGLGLLFGAFVLFFLSVHIAVCSGFYFKEWEKVDPERARTLKEVKFKVRFSYYRIFARYFFFLLPFFQGVVAETIPFSILVGIVIGLLMDYGVYIARRRQNTARHVAKFVFVIMTFLSGILVGSGVYLIVHFWEDSESDTDMWWLVSMLLTFLGEGLIHVLLWWSSRKKYLQEGFQRKNRFTKSMAKANPNRPRMATSMIIETLRNSREKKKNPSELEKDAAALEPFPEEEEAGRVDEDKSPPEPNEHEPREEAPNEENSHSGEENLRNGGILHHDDDIIEDHEIVNGQKWSEELLFNEQDTTEEPTYKKMLSDMFGGLQCCGCARGEERSRPRKIISAIYWTLWFTLVGFSLWLVVVNQGATSQQEAARAKLPYVQAVLYDNMDEGPVCAFDNRGADSNITTFPDKEAAHAEGFLILHCGACGACSDWHNLGKEYTTRNFLASKSAACARKSLFGGRQAVLDCLKEEPIGFQGKCAECWVDDILCTKERCSFIYLQSIMINAVSDMQVNADTITAAACEEAHCEAGNPGDFVFCSGATRRRMNVTSTIARPGAQRCGIVDVDWAELFPE